MVGGQDGFFDNFPISLDKIVDFFGGSLEEKGKAGS